MDHGFSTENGAIFEFHTMDVVNSEGALESFWNFGLSRTVAPLHGCDLFHLRMVMVIASLALSAPMVPWSGPWANGNSTGYTWISQVINWYHISITSVLITDLPHKYFMLPQKFVCFFRWVPPCFRGKDAGMAQCVPCAPGTANPLTGMTACIPCLVGRRMGVLLGRPGFESLDVDVEPLDDECWCWMMLDGEWYRSLSDHFPDFPMGIGTLDSLAGHFMNISGALLCEQCPMGSFGSLRRRAFGVHLTVHGWCVHGVSSQRESKVSNFYPLVNIAIENGHL